MRIGLGLASGSGSGGGIKTGIINITWVRRRMVRRRTRCARRARSWPWVARARRLPAPFHERCVWTLTAPPPPFPLSHRPPTTLPQNSVTPYSPRDNLRSPTFSPSLLLPRSHFCMHVHVRTYTDDRRSFRAGVIAY